MSGARLPAGKIFEDQSVSGAQSCRTLRDGALPRARIGSPVREPRVFGRGSFVGSVDDKSGRAAGGRGLTRHSPGGRVSRSPC